MKRQRKNNGTNGVATTSTPSSFNTALPDSAAGLKALENLHGLLAPHIESFNYVMDNVVDLAAQSILAQEIQLSENRRIRIWYENVIVGSPVKVNSGDELDVRLFPAECRERGINYSAPITATICCTVDGSGKVDRVKRQLGFVPIMVGSNRCHLYKLSSQQLVKRHEDATELGGYFICNGIERVIRILQVPRRNHMMAMLRPSYTNRGPQFSNKAVAIRCVGPDETGATVVLHYLHDGTATVRILIRKNEYFIPVMLLLKALKKPMSSDKEMYTHILRGAHLEGDTFMSDRIELALRQIAPLQLYSAAQCRAYLGSQFRSALYDVPESASDEQAGQRLIERHIFVHLSQDKRADQAKFELLVAMVRKLYSFVSGKTGPDNADALCNHELLLGGHLYGAILKERLENLLIGVRTYTERDVRSKPNPDTFANAVDVNYIKRALDRQPDIGKKLFYFLSTGNLISETGLDLQQTSGFTVVAEKLNRFRYMSHFRAVHRGQFFTEMRTTAVRKLLPESWGFLCPVHTPDGSPCGLLNHMAAQCSVVTHRMKADKYDPNALVVQLVEWGMIASGSAGGDVGMVFPHDLHVVMLDGKVVGHASPDLIAKSIVPKLRRAKSVALDTEIEVGRKAPFVNTASILESIHQEHDGTKTNVPASLEVCHIPVTPKGGAYSGLYLFTDPARMLRPVINLDVGKVELIGPMAQAFMEVAVKADEVKLEKDTHVEIYPAAMLSMIASLTPFSDFNQSPRNMYQCQMGKQTMGTPYHNIKHRIDSKAYRIQNPQAPVVQCSNQANFIMDEYPNGTNAVVAVISYTGYDMEDACILNKSSVERGFAHATVYKTETIDLSDEKFCFIANSHPNQDGILLPSLGVDGLPEVGQRIGYGEPLASIVDHTSGHHRATKHKSSEIAVVDTVRILATDSTTGGVKKASVTLRYNRNPIVGDKFASRAGQKGVMSIAWPQEDMPFTDSGITPDLIINPHAFPSRMTIGMLLESMAGKSGALHGTFQDSTPFTLQGDEENETAVDYFGKQLKAAGYSYYGAETMYSGLLGTPLEVEIYIGVVYYQRLRHMVSDKSQVRSTGPIDSLTRQPIKGRKRGGGVRFGEMERDSLLAHGTAFLVQDRLLNCSDRHIAYICCGSLLSTHRYHNNSEDEDPENSKIYCRLCNRTDQWKAIVIPYVFRYLVNELAAMGVRLSVS